MAINYIHVVMLCAIIVIQVAVLVCLGDESDHFDRKIQVGGIVATLFIAMLLLGSTIGLA